MLDHRFNEKRLTQLKNLLEIQYEKIHEYEKAIELADGQSQKIALRQQLERNLIPRLREIEHEYALANEACTQDVSEASTQDDSEAELLSLIKSGESERVEFKEGAIRNPHKDKRDERMRDNILKAVAAFMNSPTGGTLLIGVHDNGVITGVDVEYPIANKQKANWDGYELFLSDVLNNKLEIPNPFKFYTIDCHPIQGKDICRIQVDHATQPVYVQKKLYVRNGPQSKELRGPDLFAYVKTTWPDA